MRISFGKKKRGALEKWYASLRFDFFAIMDRLIFES
jgi:hypothetical protein